MRSACAIAFSLIVATECIAQAPKAWSGGPSRPEPNFVSRQFGNLPAPRFLPGIVNPLGTGGPQIGAVTMGGYIPTFGPSHPKYDFTPSYPPQWYMPYLPAYEGLIRQTYGARLAHASYFGLGMKDYALRIERLKDWILLMSPNGVPTVALEPAASTDPAMIHDVYGNIREGNPEMDALRHMFAELQLIGVGVKIRFASEANLWGSKYSAVMTKTGIEDFRLAARRFRTMMPSNVQMVFSPLLNCTTGVKRYARTATFWKTIALYDPDTYDFAGGTLFARPDGNIVDVFERYYREIKKKNPEAQFVICELGGANDAHGQVEELLTKAISGEYRHLRHVNLFVFPNLHGDSTVEKGDLIDPDTQKSYFYPVITENALQS